MSTISSLRNSLLSTQESLASSVYPNLTQPFDPNVHKDQTDASLRPNEYVRTPPTFPSTASPLFLFLPTFTVPCLPHDLSFVPPEFKNSQPFLFPLYVVDYVAVTYVENVDHLREVRFRSPPLPPGPSLDKA